MKRAAQVFSFDSYRQDMTIESQKNMFDRKNLSIFLYGDSKNFNNIQRFKALKDFIFSRVKERFRYNPTASIKCVALFYRN